MIKRLINKHHINRDVYENRVREHVYVNVFRIHHDLTSSSLIMNYLIMGNDADKPPSRFINLFIIVK